MGAGIEWQYTGWGESVMLHYVCPVPTGKTLKIKSPFIFAF